MIAGILGPVMIWKASRLSREERYLYFASDGYVAQTLPAAKNASCVARFMALVFLGTVPPERFGDIPARMALHAALSVTLGVFSVAFLITEPGRRRRPGSRILMRRATLTNDQGRTLRPSTVIAFQLARHFVVAVEDLVSLEES